MTWRTYVMAVVLTFAVLGLSGVAAANHDGGEQCDQLENALDAIGEYADEEAEDNNAVERAQDECEGDHHQDEANDGADNAGDNDGGSDNADRGDNAQATSAVVGLGLVP